VSTSTYSFTRSIENCWPDQTRSTITESRTFGNFTVPGPFYSNRKERRAAMARMRNK
jgi:hypothetical protein